MLCKICGAHASKFDEGMVLGKHIVAYFLCNTCGFVFTESPYWLDEAYSEVINRYDIGLISRNREMAYYTKSLINAFFRGNGQFLDYGGGYGMFVRMMRDEGFDFYRYDPMCRNLFADGFDMVNAPQQRFEAVTAFEVLEHLVDPLPEIEKMVAYGDTIIFSTLMIWKPPPKIGTWWYYGLEHGQHVSFYTLSSFQTLAHRLGLHFYTNYNNLHIFTKQTLPAWLVKGMFHRNPLLRTWTNLRHRRTSLLLQDSERLKQDEPTKSL